MALAGRTIADLARELSRGAVTSEALIDESLEAISRDSSAFTRLYEEQARSAARQSDTLRAAGTVRSPLEGIPISIKDLFDVRGQPTPAGSHVLRGAPAATEDAPVIARLRAAGAVIVGRTHMSEFAFSGLGTNPHLPRLANPRDASRVPGGSSSGAAVSVARGQVAMGLGTDTGGSTRIPAAFCGVVGLKPTQRRITLTGAFPLAPTLDSVGPIANSVGCCAIVDRIIADAPTNVHASISLDALRLAVPADVVFEDLEPSVNAAFNRAIAALERASVSIQPVLFPEFTRVRELSIDGTIANAEAYAVHARLSGGAFDGYDPNVRARLEIGRRMTDAQYKALLLARTGLITDANKRSAEYDALVMPTMATVAPRFADVESPRGWTSANALTLRNTSLVNFFDRCAVSIPMHRPEELPMGLMLVGETMADSRTLAIAEAVEGCLRASA